MKVKKTYLEATEFKVFVLYFYPPGYSIAAHEKEYLLEKVCFTFQLIFKITSAEKYFKLCQAKIMQFTTLSIGM